MKIETNKVATLEEATLVLGGTGNKILKAANPARIAASDMWSVVT